VWTPKRILILLAGLSVFLGGYSVYAYFLGGIDGLPELPEIWRPEQCGKTSDDDLVIGNRGGKADENLSKAFGPDCPELQWAIKLDLPSRGWVFASKYMEPVDGRVKLWPLSVCIFPKEPTDGFPEINTLQCEEAYLTLDKPVTNTTELSNRKVENVELRTEDKKGIVIKNNRRTPNLSDDLVITIKQAPLYYDARSNLIWTEGAVQMLDFQTRPHPTVITALGMNLHLTKNSSAPALSAGPVDKKSRTNNDAISGVDKLVLKKNVDMHLSVDAKSGFLANSQGSKQRDTLTDVDAPPEKTPVHVSTTGSFTYTLATDTAVFESLPGKDPNASTKRVHIDRRHRSSDSKDALVDKLVADYLELHFRKKVVVESASPREGKGVEKEIDRAYARSNGGAVVELDLKTENLSARGDELIYVAATDKTGPQTVLRGKPLFATKDNHQLDATELHLIAADKYGNGQHALAKGPGEIRLFSNNPRQAYPIKAIWKDTLTLDRVKENGKIFDLLILTKEALIQDDEHNQELHGERLEIMAEPAPAAANTSPPAKADANTVPTSGSKQRLHRVDCFENVRAYSPDFIVKLTQVLYVRFDEKPVKDDRLPETPSASGPPNTGPTPPTSGQTPSASTDAAAAKTRPPVELEAQQVTVMIKRGVTKDELSEMIAEGEVHVHRDGDKADDKGVDIKGNFLRLTHRTAGDELEVKGDSKKIAETSINDLHMKGQKITVDQEKNTTLISGAGYMNMPTTTTFEGTKPAKKDARITVYWDKLMAFDGKRATFTGNVQANQDNTWLRCLSMEVTLDRHVSFKEKQEPSKDGQGAKVDRIRCDNQVTVVDDLRDGQQRYLKFNGLSAVSLTMDNLDEKAIASGPGQVAILAPAGSNFAAVSPGSTKPAPTPVSGQAMKLTRIFYDGMIYMKKINNQRISHFQQNVRVLHFPANTPKAEMNPDRPPPDGFYMKSDELKVLTQTKADGKTSQTMEALSNVEFRATPASAKAGENIFGRAYKVSFDEASDLVVLEGKDSSRATLYQYTAEGNTRTINARKILYNRKTGNISVEGGGGVEGR
jgi:lipopolysaccharide export system protein LptA